MFHLASTLPMSVISAKRKLDTRCYDTDILQDFYVLACLQGDIIWILDSRNIRQQTRNEHEQQASSFHED